MNPKTWTIHEGVIASIPRADIDTDQILPKQFMKKIERNGFGKHLFHDWRYKDVEGNIQNPEFVLNQGPFQNASILIVGENFGCGSSREHAPWALADFGIRAILSVSFADIFSINAAKNGIALVRLKEEEIKKIQEEVQKHPGKTLTVDLDTLQVRSDEQNFSFYLEQGSVDRIRNGWDDIDLTLREEEKIRSFESGFFTEHRYLSVSWEA
ncbi:3-isopropylmalate dehydratase small subunit [Leptospira langatensis]|uniref:3-isopropylmalate dehydratase small subunit n=1 Tax=Leptospira langatensis TaxID=2484983 RepID=A0A5F1ZX76_9LEPT|nr:3-isopropylmalate dehydratase small subunit [Leptospira langatensis]TGJ98482.1 3-isopropylmalate dehydratase small subunit [Leptospira langatensis]TGL43396.1 3-isopropylmalate dehydratase small subunit [Leptospira langatensis]